MFTDYTNFRDLARKPKKVIEEVKKNKKAKVVLDRNKKPQAAIISLEDLEKLQQTKATQAAINMLKFALENRRKLKGLPTDLRIRADEILYSK